jgi:hypothetical protein
VGDVCEVECAAGYTLVGTNTSYTCGADGLWYGGCDAQCVAGVVDPAAGTRLVLSAARQSHSAIVTTCTNMGMTPTTFTSKSVTDALALSLGSATAFVWANARRGTGNAFVNLDGSAFALAQEPAECEPQTGANCFFAAGEPDDNNGNEDCLQILTTKNTSVGYAGDTKCSFRRFVVCAEPIAAASPGPRCVAPPTTAAPTTSAPTTAAPTTTG